MLTAVNDRVALSALSAAEEKEEKGAENDEDAKELAALTVSHPTGCRF